MSDFKEKSSEIINKCIELGCLTLPDIEYLEKIERSRNCTVLDNFTQRVHDRQKIREVRDNILVHTSKDDTRPTAKLPAQLQLFMQSKALTRQIHEAKGANNEVRRKEQILLDEILQNSKRLVASENAINTLISKVAVLKARVITLQEEHNKEVEAEQKIRSVQPLKLGISHNAKELKEKVNKLSGYLCEFFRDMKAAADPAMYSTWSKLQETAQDLPNFFVFQEAMKELDMNITRLSDLNSSTEVAKPSGFPMMDKIMPELSEQIVLGGVTTLAGRRKLALLKSKCSDAIQTASYRLEDLQNFDDADNSYRAEDLSRDYLAAMLKNFSLTGKLQLLSEINSKKKQAVNGHEHNKEDFATFLQEAQKIIALCEKRIDDGQQSVAHLLMINERLNSGKFSMARMVQELKNHSKQLSMSRGMKFTQVFGPELPPHSKELEFFLSIPLENFAKHCMASSEPGDNIFMKDEEGFCALVKQGLVDVLNLCEFLSTAEKSLNWYDVLKIQAAKKINSHPKVIQHVSINELEGCLQLNREAISEFLDAISKNHATSKRLLSECQTLYKYWLDNPLKRFIPDSKKFDGKSFKIYEKDFNLYYRMLKN